MGSALFLPQPAGKSGLVTKAVRSHRPVADEWKKRGGQLMHFLKVYGRVFGVLGKDARVAALLCVANLIVAALSFLDPVLFGRVIQLLAGSDTMPETELWRRATYLLGIWAA